MTGLAAALGAAATLITFVISTDISREPEHLAFAPAMFFGATGGIAGALIVWPIISWLSKDNAAHSFREWMLAGVVFGLLLPFVTGALLPASHVFLGLSLGVIQSGELISGLLSSIFRMPVEIIVHVAQGILTGMLIGVVFGVGAWILDRINWSRSTVVADIGSWTVAIVLGTGAVLLALFGSPDTLARLG
jgi:uncharacterized membrane protein